VQSAGIGIGWLWIPGLSLLALLGLFLLWRGLRPRREGTTPYCRKCGYNLTGTDRDAEGARCPECGTYVTTPDVVVFGERHVRPRRVVAGVLCLLLGLAPLTVVLVGELKQVDWYSYMPTDWVLADIRTGGATRAARALREMTQRFSADGLTPEQIAELPELCLAVHKRLGQQAIVGMPAMQLLDRLYINDLLTPGQTERFFSQMVEVSLLMRPRVVHGEALFIGAMVAGRGPDRSYSMEARLEDVRVDGRQPRDGSRLYSYRSATGYHDHPLGYACIITSDVGKHTVTVDVPVVIYTPDKDELLGTPPGSIPDDGVLHSQVHQLTGTLEVLAEEPPEFIRLTHSPELDRTVQSRVTLQECYVDGDHPMAAPYGASTRCIRAQVRWLGRPPIGLAFDAYAEIHGQRVGIGQVTTSRIRWSADYGGPLWICAPEPIPDRITIILRSSKAAAAYTPDLDEIWDGELWFEDMEILSEPEDNRMSWSREGRFRPTLRRRDPLEDDSAWPPVPVGNPWVGPIPTPSTFGSAERSWAILDDDWLTAEMGKALEEGQGLGDQAAELFSRLFQRPTTQATGPTSRAWEWSSTPPEHSVPASVPSAESLANRVEFSLRIRPAVVCGQEFFVGAEFQDTEAGGPLRLRIELDEIRFGCGDTIRPQRRFSTQIGFSPFRTSDQLGTYAKLDQPGKWAVEADVEFELDDPASTGWSWDGTCLHRGKRTVTGEIEVLPEEPPGLFKLTHSPELDEAIATRLRLSEFSAEEQHGWGREARRRLQGMLWFPGPLPIGVAFEAFAEIGDQRIRSNWPIIESLDRAAGGPHGVGVSFDYDGDTPGTITVILGSSKAAAMRTPDLYEIWDGELRFENVEVAPADASQWPRTGGRYVPTIAPRAPAPNDRESSEP